MTASAQDIGVVHTSARKASLYRAIYEELSASIRRGEYRQGDRLPSESELCKRFGASRITVSKAIQTLQQDGLVVRRAGSGSYIQLPVPSASYQFGLLIPELGRTEIFEPVCQGIMRSPQAKSHSLIWGHMPVQNTTVEEAALGLCRQFVQQRVSGVFFAPLEFSAKADTVNRQIVTELGAAGIPIVLLDRDYLLYPSRSNLDRVGIDNYRASYVVTRHLWQRGARRIVFVARQGSASTIRERACGYLFALRESASEYAGDTAYGDTGDESFVRDVLERQNPDAIVCGNDLTAAKLMHTLISMGIRIPERIRLASFDDVHYAQFLPVPLTTIHQNCAQIGEFAMMAMLARIENRERSGVDLNVPFELVVRESCGSAGDS